MIKSYLIKLSLSFYMLLAMETNSSAYLDPGTGSMILTAILGVLAALLTMISTYWAKFKKIVHQLLNKFKKENKNLN